MTPPVPPSPVVDLLSAAFLWALSRPFVLLPSILAFIQSDFSRACNHNVLGIFPFHRSHCFCTHVTEDNSSSTNNSKPTLVIGSLQTSDISYPPHGGDDWCPTLRKSAPVLAANMTPSTPHHHRPRTSHQGPIYFPDFHTRHVFTPPHTTYIVQIELSQHLQSCLENSLAILLSFPVSQHHDCF